MTQGAPDIGMPLLFRSLQQQAPPGATLHCWRLQVLVGNSTAQSSGWRQAELDAAVRRVLQPAVVVSHVSKAVCRPREECRSALLHLQEATWLLWAPSSPKGLPAVCIVGTCSRSGTAATTLQEWHEGAHATALAAFWGVERLPGAVLLPPFCHVGTCEVRYRCRRRPCATRPRPTITVLGS